MSKVSVRTTIILSSEVAEKLKELVPSRQRSKFIEEAIEQKLMQMVFRQGRELSFGAWSDDKYPHLKKQSDVQKYISKMRDDSNWRKPEEG
ncbi:hypothetical protein GF312_05375 [Candidatus Poribacteria bacterium]|nr:hypothetical protein [Candidatus Poribacteria bacterium]